MEVVITLKKLLRPQVLIPGVLVAGLLVGLLSFSDLPKVIALIGGFQRIYLLWFLLLMLAYTVLRGVQWHYLLTALGIEVPLKTQIFAFAAGEVTKSMPIGNYFQNYLLQQARGADFGRSSAATTLIILTEVAVSLLGVVILGLGAWTGIVRPVIVIGLAIFALCAWAFQAFHRRGRAPTWLTEHETLLKALDEVRQFREGAAALLHPRVLAIQALLGTAYLIAGGSALYVVVRGLGIGRVGFWETLAVYFFSLAFALIVPIPVDVGVIEVSAVGAFVVEGLTRDSAVSAVLANRVLTLGASVVIAAIVILVLHDEFRAALRERSERSSASGDSVASQARATDG